MNPEGIAFAYVGTVVPDTDEYVNTGFNRAGNMSQQYLLMGMINAGLKDLSVFSVAPLRSFPATSTLFVRGGRARIKDGIEITFVPYFNITPIKQLGIGLAIFWKLVRWGWRKRAAPHRVVYTFNLSVPPGTFTLLAARMIRAKAFVWLNDINVPGHTVPYSWKWKIDYQIQKWLIPKFDGHVPVSDSIMEDFAPRRPYVLVEGGVDDAVFTETTIHCGSSAERDLFVVACAGTLNDYNGIPVVLDAFCRLTEKHFRLRIAGGGPLEERVRDAAAKDPRIEYCGFLSFQEVLRFYNSADVLVNMRVTKELNTRYFFPSKMMEYLASGRPVITSNTGNVEEEFKDFVFLLQEESAESLAEKIRYVSTLGKDQREEMGARARRYMEKNKTWKVQARKVIEYIDGIVRQ